jgi:hypothetical protein
MYILIIHTNGLRRYKYVYCTHARLKLPECIKSNESVSHNWSLACAMWVFAVRQNFPADVSLARQTVVSSSR